MLRRSPAQLVMKWRPIDAYVRGKGRPHNQHRRSLFGKRGHAKKWMKSHGLRDSRPVKSEQKYGVRSGAGGLFGARSNASREYIELPESEKEFLVHGETNITNRIDGDADSHPLARDVTAPVPISFRVALMLNVGPKSAGAGAAKVRIAETLSALVLEQLEGGAADPGLEIGDAAESTAGFDLTSLHVFGRWCRLDLDLARFDGALAAGAIAAPDALTVAAEVSREATDAPTSSGDVTDVDDGGAEAGVERALRVAVDSFAARDAEIGRLMRESNGQADASDCELASMSSPALAKLANVTGPPGTVGAAAVSITDDSRGALRWVEDQLSPATMVAMAAPIGLRDGQRRGPTRTNLASTHDWLRQWWRAHDPARHVCGAVESQREAAGVRTRRGTAHRLQGLLLVPVKEPEPSLAAAMKRRRLSMLAEPVGEVMLEATDFASRRSRTPSTTSIPAAKPEL